MIALPDSRPVSPQVRDVVLQAAAGLQSLGLQKGDHVSLFSENSAKWLIMEQVHGQPSSIGSLLVIPTYKSTSDYVVITVPVYTANLEPVGTSPLLLTFHPFASSRVSGVGVGLCTSGPAHGGPRVHSPDRRATVHLLTQRQQGRGATGNRHMNSVGRGMGGCALKPMTRRCGCVPMVSVCAGCSAAEEAACGGLARVQARPAQPRRAPPRGSQCTHSMTDPPGVVRGKPVPGSRR